MLRGSLSVVAMTGLLVSVTVSERNRHQQTLHKAKVELEDRVLDRTRELEGRIAAQERAERALRDLSVRLLRAQDEERRRIARELHMYGVRFLANQLLVVPTKVPTAGKLREDAEAAKSLR